MRAVSIHLSKRLILGELCGANIHRRLWHTFSQISIYRRAWSVLKTILVKAQTKTTASAMPAVILSALIGIGAATGWVRTAQAQIAHPSSDPTEPAAETATNATAPQANPASPPSAPAKKSAAELEKLLMPIALHPDPLMAIILPASAYPLEIVQAARFVKDTNNIPKVADQPWDDNVKELAKYPDMIAKMDAELPWTMELGQAFIDQPEEVMGTIQELRAKAKKAGTLQDSPQQVVTVTNVVVQQTDVTTHEVVEVNKEVIQVVPSNPQVIYVPTYPPVVYAPPPGYAPAPYAPLVTFGVGMAVGAVIANNNCNWGHGHVDVHHHGPGGPPGGPGARPGGPPGGPGGRPPGGPQAGNRPPPGGGGGGQQWKPNPNRVQQSGAMASSSARQARGYPPGGGGGGAQGARQPNANANAANRQPGAGGARPQPSTANAGNRQQGAGGAGARPTPNAGASRSPGGQGSGAGANRSAPQRSGASAGSRPSSGGSAFNSSGGGSSSRAASSRGSASRGGGGGGGGGGRGGGGGGRR
jgi:hypothetical protein